MWRGIVWLYALGVQPKKTAIAPTVISLQDKDKEAVMCRSLPIPRAEKHFDFCGDA